jgi:hypothetical protein
MNSIASHRIRRARESRDSRSVRAVTFELAELTLRRGRPKREGKRRGLTHRDRSGIGGCDGEIERDEAIGTGRERWC